MNKLLAVLISSAVLVTAGQAFAQPAAGDTSGSGSSMSKDPSMSDNGMAKESQKQKRMHRKSKSKSDAIRNMGTPTDNSVQNQKNP